MVNLAEGVARRGYPVDLVLAKAKGPYLEQVAETVRVVDLNAYRCAASLPGLARYLVRERPGAMLSVTSGANVVALLARRLVGLPSRLVVNEQNTLSQWVNRSSNWRIRLTPRLVKYSYRWANAVVAVSHGVADDLIATWRIPADRVEVIYNAGVTPQLRRKALAQVDHPWLDSGQPPLVLAVGSLTVQKDFGTLLRAFAKVRANRPARLMILGEGRERPRLEESVRALGLEEDVQLPGWIDNPYAYMTRASVFTLSSRWEGLPTVLVEALYCGARVVATDCPNGPREILKNGEYGRLVPVGDVDELARAIAMSIGGNAPPAPRESWQPYDVDNIVGKYVDLLFGRAG